MLFYYESNRGCRIINASGIKEAEEIAFGECGSLDEPREVRKATQIDTAWFVAMGGYIPKKIKNGGGD